METPQAQSIEAKPKTKKVRMPDGEIRIKVQQPDGTWKWQKNETPKNTTSPASTSIPPTAVQQTTTTSTTPTAKAPLKKTAPSKASTFPVDKAATKKAPAKKKPATAANVGRFFRAAKILDAVLPEHLKVADDLAEDLGIHTDNDDNNNSKGGHPTSASSKELAKVAAGGMKTKSKRAKRSVYRPGETGSSDESDLDEKSPSSSADTIGTVKERTTIDDNKAFDEKRGLEITEKEMKPVKKRRSRGRRLQRRTSRLAQGVSWGIALFFPLLFIILAMMNASMSQKHAMNDWQKPNKLGKRLMQANKICVSMWPILFGAIVAQSFKMYAAWKVERGIKLITLEQLIGSHSLATAIKQPFFLQTMNWTAIGMICLWALSPLAGQSFLRMLTVEDRMSNYTLTNITYPDFSQPLTYAFEQPTFDNNKTMIDLMFATVLLSAAGEQVSSDLLPNDPWQNANFFISGPLNYKHWYPGDIPFTFVGLPIMNTPGIDWEKTYKNMSLLANYSYFAMRCDDPFNTTIDSLNANFSTSLHSNTAKDNWMSSLPPANNDAAAVPSILYAQNHTLNNADENGYGLIITNETVPTDVTAWKCDYYNKYVQILYTCWNGGLECSALNNNSLPNGTNIVLNDVFVTNFLNTPVLQGSGQILKYSSYDLMNLGFTNGLTNLVNAYWQVGFTYPILNRAHQSELNEAAVHNVVSATVHVWEGMPVFQVGWLWFSIVVIACVLLIVFGVTGIILDTRTVGPDIIGFASSLTRDNRYIKLAEEDIENFGGAEEEGASSKNAYESIRDMKHHKVMLQDVRGHEEVGKVALGSYGVKNGKPLQRDRLYR